MSKPVSMQDIADRANVTKTTVSLALRNNQRISTDTRKRIQDLAEEMGYRPNPMVTTLMTQVQARKGGGTGSKIALLGPEKNEQMALKSEWKYTRLIYEGLRIRADELGYGIDIIEPTPMIGCFETCVRVIRTRGIRGVVLPPFVGGSQGLNAEFDCEDFAVVGVGYSQRIEGIHRVTHDLFDIAFNLTSLALRKGYRNIGMHLSPEMDIRTGRKYPGGFLGALFEQGITELRPNQILYSDGTPEAFLNWVNVFKPDAIISQYSTDYQILREKNFVIPRDIGFALHSYQDDLPHITGYAHHPTNLAYAAIDMVTSHLHRNETGKPVHQKRLIIPSQLMEGTTL